MPTPSIALIGDPARIAEAKTVLTCEVAFEGADAPRDLRQFTHVLDLNLEDFPERIAAYQRFELIVIGAAVKRSMMSMLNLFDGTGASTFIGVNALPGFLSRPRWELSYIGETEKNLIHGVGEVLGVEVEAIQDRAGMVAPRVLFLIINEAFLLMQEGTAKVGDIDTAMRLGTNYPNGPFEWAVKIGLNNIIETLEAMFEETGDLRFKPVDALKKAAFLTAQ